MPNESHVEINGQRAFVIAPPTSWETGAQHGGIWPEPRAGHRFYPATKGQRGQTMQDAHVIALIAHDVLLTGKKKRTKAALKYAAAFLDDAKKFSVERGKSSKKTRTASPRRQRKAVAP
jgi:hypothetical protein